MQNERYDIVMLGTFAMWRLGTLQARALPFAAELARRGFRCAIVTSPWDMPSESGVVEARDGVLIVNTASASGSTVPAVRQQLAEVERLQPRLVHLFKPRGFGGLAARQLLGRLPVVVDSDDWEGDGGWNRRGAYSLPQRRLFDWQERTLIRDASAVTAASTLLARRSSMLRDSARAIRRIPNGLTPEWIDTLHRARIHAREIADPHPSTVLLYSRFEEFEHDWPQRFSTALRRYCHDVRIIAVGGGSSQDIEQMGYVARDDLPTVLASATAAVFPYADSLITRGKQSVKLLELMSAGCAVVASAVGDVPAVLGRAGRVVPGHDPESFAAEVATLLTNGAVARSLGDCAYRRVREQFSIPVVVDELVELYCDLGLTPR